MDLASSPLIIIAAIVIVIMIVIFAIMRRYKIASPNEAFIITGRRGKGGGDLSGQKVVTGSGVFVVPIVQTRYVMDLSARRINVPIRGAVSKAGVKLNVDGIAIVKVGGDEQSIRAAAQRFLTQQEEVEVFATEVLSGALRSIVGTLTVEEIISDRIQFAAQVADITESTLTGQGLTLDTFQIQDVTDYEDGTYLRDLGRPEQARVTQAASVAESLSRQAQEEAKISADGRVLESQRMLSLQQATVLAETDAAQAEAEAAGPLARARKQQEVLAEQAHVAQAQAALTDRELDTTVRKPADAERYRVEQEAEARRAVTIAAAEAAGAATVASARAKQQADQLTGEGELALRTAQAKALEVEGKAQAAATEAIGGAEAAAMSGMAVRTRSRIAAPMAGIDNLTIVSTDGASAVSRTVTDNFAQLQEMVKATTGVDLAAIISRLQTAAPTAESGGTSNSS
jgi:flotillin